MMKGKDCASVNVWETLPGRFRQAVRSVLELRQELVPYMYTEARKFFDSGVPWMRPLYYDFGNASNLSFEFPAQYMFGDLLTVAPIVQQSKADTPSITEWTLFVPPGVWYSPNDGFLIEGNSTYTRFWDLSEVPYLLRAGSILPKRQLPGGKDSRLGLAMRNNTDLVFDIIPGSLRGEVSVYEDDGSTTDYVNNTNVGWVFASYEKTGKKSKTGKIQKTGKNSKNRKNV
jgi:alpha-glucosidase